MQVESATLAGGSNNQDRLFVTENAVIVLDGASAFEPIDVDAGHYAEILGRSIAEYLAKLPLLDVSDAVAAGIRHAAFNLDLVPGRSPSSTVSIVRRRPGSVDLYVLGDTPVHFGTKEFEQTITDDRIDFVAEAERLHYRLQLAAGHGFNDEHRASLAQLQRRQLQARNRLGGYWIAESCPKAAAYGFSRTVADDSVSWIVLATDGAAETIDHTHGNWAAISTFTSQDLRTLLHDLHRWESTIDPNGLRLPRAKVHDDKTVVAIRV